MDLKSPFGMNSPHSFVTLPGEEAHTQRKERREHKQVTRCIQPPNGVAQGRNVVDVYMLRVNIICWEKRARVFRNTTDNLLFHRADLAELTAIVLIELGDLDVSPVLQRNLLSLGETVGVTTLHKGDGREPHRALSDLRALQRQDKPEREIKSLSPVFTRHNSPLKH